MRLNELYAIMESNHIVNKSDSQYWIMDIDNRIVNENGINNRYLIVTFFNRFLNENNSIMRMYLNINNEDVEEKRFMKSNLYNDPNVLMFKREIDITENGKNVVLNGYVINGEKIDLQGKAVNKVILNVDNSRTSLLTNYYYHKEHEAISLPVFADDYWICCCGSYNSYKDTNCPVCKHSRTEISKINSLNYKKLILNNINTVIKLDHLHSIDESVDKYCTKVSEKYGISKNELLQYVNYDDLEKKHIHCIHNAIKDYINKHPNVKFNAYISFDDNIKNYCKPIIGPFISENMVRNNLDMNQLKKRYEKTIKNPIDPIDKAASVINESKEKIENTIKTNKSNFSMNIDPKEILGILCFILFVFICYELVTGNLGRPKSMDACYADPDYAIWIDGKCYTEEEANELFENMEDRFGY